MSWMGAIGGAGLAVASAALVGRGLAVLQRQVERSEPITSVAFGLGMLAPGVGLALGFALAYAFEVGSAVVAATGARPLAGALASGLYVSFVAVGTIAGYLLGIRPLRRRTLEAGIRVPARFRRRYRLVGVLVVTLAAVLVELPRAPGWPLDAWVAVPVLVGGWLGVYLPLTMPARLSAGQSPFRCRTPTDGERRRIEACYERFGRTPGRIIVAPESASLDVAVAGEGLEHTLAITAPFLNRVDDETLAVALAQADERGRRGFFTHVLRAAALLALVVLAGLYSFVGMLSDPGFAVVAACGVVFAIGWPFRGMKRATFTADRFAATELGTETVRCAYERVGEDLSTSMQFERLASVFRRFGWSGPFEPDVAARIDALGTEDE